MAIVIERGQLYSDTAPLSVPWQVVSNKKKKEIETETLKQEQKRENI